MTLLIGCDPEVFLVNKATSKFVTALNIIPGTKEMPHPIPGGALQVDGLAAEFNIDPAATSAQFITNIETVMTEMLQWIPNELDVSISATADFDKDYMDAQPEESKVLGCDPDFDAYVMDVNPRPDQHDTMRTAAGHVHLGWTDNEDVGNYKHFAACATLTKQLDFYLGIPSVLLDPDTKRKGMYGKAGAFRPKSYGAEYRVLSNFWLKDKKLMGWVFDQAHMAFDLLANKGVRLIDQYGDVCRTIINTNDKAAAEDLMKKLGISLPV